MAATVAVVTDEAPSSADLLGRLGRVDARGELTFAEADELQTSLYAEGDSERRAVIQVGRLPGVGGAAWVLVEPNGFRCSIDWTLLKLAGVADGASVQWNVNADGHVLKVTRGRVVANFDPLLDVDRVPPEGRDLPFGVEEPTLASMSLLQLWTGVDITGEWFRDPKDTFIVDTPVSQAPPGTGSRGAPPGELKPIATVAPSGEQVLFAMGGVPLTPPATGTRGLQGAPRYQTAPGVIQVPGIRLADVQPSCWHVTMNDGAVVEVWAHGKVPDADHHAFVYFLAEQDIPKTWSGNVIPSPIANVHALVVARFPSAIVTSVVRASVPD